MSSVATPTMKFTLRNDGIIVGQGRESQAPRTRQEVVANLAAMDDLLGGKLAPGLWLPGSELQYEPEALQSLIHGLVDRLSAVALVTSDPPPGLAAFPAAVNALLLPMRIFTDEADAEEWLRQFI